jgi:cytochrome P450
MYGAALSAVLWVRRHGAAIRLDSTEGFKFVAGDGCSAGSLFRRRTRTVKLLTDEFYDDPFPTFERSREAQGLQCPADVGGPLITRYPSVVAALREPRLASDRVSVIEGALSDAQRQQATELLRSLRAWCLFADPPEHRRLRNVFAIAFASASVDELAPVLEGCVRDLLEPLARKEQVEIMSEFAQVLPLRVSAALLGIDLAVIDRVQALMQDVEGFLGPPIKTEEMVRKAIAAESELRAVFEHLAVALKTTGKGAPVFEKAMSMVAADQDPKKLSHDEAISACILTLFAAHSTTAYLLGTCISWLAAHPETRAALRAEPSSVPSFVEELVRHDGPVQAVRRLVTEDFVFEGQELKKGQQVFLMLNAANRDEALCPHATSVEPARPETRHVAFGAGRHYCPGAQLARVEVTLAIQRLLAVRPHFEVTGSVSRVRSFGFRGHTKLPIRFLER